MTITPEQCRAARGILVWSQDELRRRAKMSRKTIADFELGMRSPYDRTLDDLRRTFEEAGIVFTEPHEGAHGPGVALKWGVELPERQQGGSTDATSGSDSLKALSWEDDLEEATEATPEMIELREHWRSNPEQWARFHESSRQVILGMMGLRQL